MKKIQVAWLLAVLAVVAAWSSPAQAQPQIYFASAAGSGTACSATAPCDLTEAIASATANLSDTMVSCINGGFSEFNFQIGSDVTIDCPGAVLTANAGNPSILINAGSQRVILRNLTFDGANDILSAPLIKVIGGESLIIENCKFQNLDFINGSSTGNGVTIQFLPNRPAAQLIIRDTLFADNGVGSTGGGLQVAPAAGGSASVLLERVSFNFNVTSMALLGPVNATMVNSTVSASRSNGILVGSGATLDIKDSTLVYNVGSAVSVSSGSTLTLSNTDIKYNQIGVSNSGGQAMSYKNNRILGNGSTATLGTITGGQ